VSIRHEAAHRAKPLQAVGKEAKAMLRQPGNIEAIA
jgi:actin-like ATPase involved in cell morphogenesis